MPDSVDPEYWRRTKSVGLIGPLGRPKPSPALKRWADSGGRDWLGMFPPGTYAAGLRELLDAL